VLEVDESACGTAVECFGCGLKMRVPSLAPDVVGAEQEGERLDNALEALEEPQERVVERTPPAEVVLEVVEAEPEEQIQVPRSLEQKADALVRAEIAREPARRRRRRRSGPRRPEEPAEKRYVVQDRDSELGYGADQANYYLTMICGICCLVLGLVLFLAGIGLFFVGVIGFLFGIPLLIIGGLVVFFGFKLIWD
jgi:hypothetical protein